MNLGCTMSIMMRTILTTFLTLVTLLGSGGCSITERCTLEGRDPEQVWAAMKAVAQTPDSYATAVDPADRWFVRDNQVWIDEEAQRIEVSRTLQRELHKPLAPVRREERSWKFEVLLELHEPPTMAFRTRNATIPAHVWEEAGRYFDEVAQFLEPTMQPAAAAPASGE